MLRLYFEVMRLRTALAPVLAPFTKTSNNQLPTIDAIDVLLAWWYGLALNIERFEHLTRYQRDPLLSRLLGRHGSRAEYSAEALSERHVSTGHRGVGGPYVKGTRRPVADTTES